MKEPTDLKIDWTDPDIAKRFYSSQCMKKFYFGELQLLKERTEQPDDLPKT